MGSISKNNLKKLLGRDVNLVETNVLADRGDVNDITSAWVVKYKGIIANGQSEVSIGTATAGKRYIIAVMASTEGAPNQFTSGDEDELVLQTVNIVLVDKGAITGGFGPSASKEEIINFVSTSSANATAQQLSSPNSDSVMITIYLDDGDITVQHSDNGGTSNGLYVVYECH